MYDNDVWSGLSGLARALPTWAGYLVARVPGGRGEKFLAYHTHMSTKWYFDTDKHGSGASGMAMYFQCCAIRNVGSQVPFVLMDFLKYSNYVSDINKFDGKDSKVSVCYLESS